MSLAVPLVLFCIGILMIAFGVAGLVNASQIGLGERVLIVMMIIGSGLVMLAIGLYVLVLIERIRDHK